MGRGYGARGRSMMCEWLAIDEAAAVFAKELARRPLPSRPYSRSPVRCVVGFAGAAGVGKTVLCRQVTSCLSNRGLPTAHVVLDGFLHDRATRNRRNVCGYERNGWQHERADESLQALLCRGEAINVPTYRPDGTHGVPTRVNPRPYVLLDGNYCLLGAIHSSLSFLAYCHGDLETIRDLRTRRDARAEHRFSDQEAELVWLRELPALRANIFPGFHQADVLIAVDKNRLRRIVWNSDSKLTRRRRNIHD